MDKGIIIIAIILVLIFIFGGAINTGTVYRPEAGDMGTFTYGEDASYYYMYANCATDCGSPGSNELTINPYGTWPAEYDAEVNGCEIKYDGDQPISYTDGTLSSKVCSIYPEPAYDNVNTMTVRYEKTNPETAPAQEAAEDAPGADSGNSLYDIFDGGDDGDTTVAGAGLRGAMQSIGAAVQSAVQELVNAIKGALWA